MKERFHHSLVSDVFIPSLHPTPLLALTLCQGPIYRHPQPQGSQSFPYVGKCRRLLEPLQQRSRRLKQQFALVFWGCKSQIKVSLAGLIPSKAIRENVLQASP